MELLVAGDRAARERDLAAVGAQRPREQVEHRGLAGAVRPDQPENFAGLHVEADIVDGDETAKSPLRVAHLKKQRAGRRLLAARQRRRRLRTGLLQVRQKTCEERDDALPGALQEQDEQRRERHDLELAGGALGDQRQVVLHGILQQRDDRSTDHAAQNAAGAADHRHHQIFDAHAGLERSGADETAEMGIEPSGQRAEERGDDERHQLDLECADPEAFDQRIAAAKRAHRAADAGVEQVVADEQDRHDDRPDQEIDLPALDQGERADRDRRNARDAVMLTEAIDVAEQERDRQSPGDRAQRQEVAAQAQRHEAQDRGDAAGQDDGQHQSEPGRIAVHRRDPGG